MVAPLEIGRTRLLNLEYSLCPAVRTTCCFRIQVESQIYFAVARGTWEIAVQSTSESKIEHLVVHRMCYVVVRSGEKMTEENTNLHQGRYLERNAVDQVVTAQDTVSPSHPMNEEAGWRMVGRTGFVMMAAAVAVKKLGCSTLIDLDWILDVQMPWMRRHQMPCHK